MFHLSLEAKDFVSTAFLAKLSLQSSLRILAITPDQVTLNFNPESDQEGVSVEPSEQQILVTGESLNLEKLAAVEQALAGKIEFLHWHLCQHDEHGQVAALADVSPCDKDVLADTIADVAREQVIEVALLGKRPCLREPGLLVMDMDSTMIAMECIDEIARLAGVGEQVAEVTELAMQGKLDFAQSLTQRVGCLAGADAAILKQVQASLPLMPGLTHLVQVLKANGWKLAIASGGFTWFANYLKDRLGLDYAISNTLQIEQGKLTGKVDSEIVDAQVKADTLTRLAAEWGIPASQTIALGDGANDLKMMSVAALGVAYKGKPLVCAKADAAIRHGGVDTLLWMLK